MFKFILTCLTALALTTNSFGAVNAMQVQLEGATSGQRNSISRLLTNGTALVGDSSNVPQVTDIATQAELNSTLASYLTISSAEGLYQPVDLDLTYISLLSTTAFGRSILELTDAASLRTLAGLVIGTNVQAYDADLDDLAIDGLLAGTKISFADTDGNFTATDVQTALEELDDTNGAGPNAGDGKVEWSQLVGVPAGFADGSDDGGGGGGSGTLSTLQEGGVAVGDPDIVTLNYGSGFDLAESPDTKITVSLDASEIFTGGDLTWSGNTPSVGANAVALGTDTTGNYVATIADAGLGEVTVTGSGSEGAAVTIAIGGAIARDLEIAAQYQPLDADLTVIGGLVDPNADRILFWDDSAGTYAYLTASSGLTISGTSITADLGTAIDSAEITDGSIVNADINASAAIALSKLATDPLARANHTGTQAWSTITSTPTTLAGYGITDSVSLSKSGTQASPTTTNPFSPTWTSQDYLIYYGVTGTINLPAVATYTNKTLIIYSTGTYTITVDPNGSEIIVKTGASLGAGVADTFSGTPGLTTAYVCDGVRWMRFEGGGSGGSGSQTPWTSNIDGASYDLTTLGNITAGTFSGSGSGLTSLPGAQLSGIIPDITIENLTTSRNNIITPVAGVSNVIVTDDGQTNITLDATTETLTYSSAPTTGAWFRYYLTAHTSDCVVTIPSTYSYSVGGNRTTFTVRANKNAYVVCHRTASGYEMWGEPVEIGDLTADTTPATSAKIEIDQGSGGEYATVAQIVNAAPAINKVTVTAPATGSTLTIADGKTLTASNTLTLTGTDSSSVAFGAGGTVGYVNGALGTPTVTSINKLAITQPATGSTLTVADGKTLTASNTLTLTGTDSSSVAFGAGGTVAYQGGSLGAATATTPSAGDNDTSVVTSAFVQTEVDGTRTGSHASPYTTASAVSPTWSGPFHAVYMGIAQTVNLPAAASYDGRGIMIYNTGAFTITIQPNASEVVVLDGTADTGGTTCTLSSGAGNYVSLVCDGTRWISLGYKGTLAP